MCNNIRALLPVTFCCLPITIVGNIHQQSSLRLHTAGSAGVCNPSFTACRRILCCHSHHRCCFLLFVSPVSATFFLPSLTCVYCSLEHWSLRGLPGQVNGLIALGLSRLPASTSAPSLIAAAPFSPIHPRRSIKSHHETIDTVREELQVLREEIASTLANLQILGETLLAADMEGPATDPSGQYIEDPMVGNSEMAVPQGTAVASGNSGPCMLLQSWLLLVHQC